MTKVAVMQPYFFPYLGYFQLISAVDVFVIYDNLQYTKKGWINRNRILVNGKDSYVSIELESSSSLSEIKEKRIADSFSREKLIRRIYGAYKKALYFNYAIKLIEEIIYFETDNLFDYVKNSIFKLSDWFNLTPEFVISSNLKINDNHHGQERLIDICTQLNAKQYINLPGGRALYDPIQFDENNLKLSFLQPEKIRYAQFEEYFVENLSILDVIMFNSNKECSCLLNKYTIN